VNRDSIYITGVGVATPLGHTYAVFAENLLAGRSGVRRIDLFPVDDHPSQIGATVASIPCPEPWAAHAFGRLAKVEQAMLWCCVRALCDAGLWERRRGLRIGVVLGNASAWTASWEHDYYAGGRAVFEAQEYVEPLVERVRRRLQVTGPAVTLSAACASSNYAFAVARRWLRLGWADVCLAGGCDMAITPMTLAGFGNLRALSRRNHDPVGASRPFDVERDGFVMGEGGALFVLESAAHAHRRGAPVYAEVAGCGASSDAYNMVIPSPHPEPAIAAMRQALADARVSPEQVGYINAHATGTPVGDQAEAQVLSTVFGPAIQRIPVSSTKSMTGHLLTAAAAVEAAACMVALQRQAIPPTINLHQPDPECRLRHVANRAEEHPVRIAVSNSFGFGGSNTCLVLRAPLAGYPLAG
jgi:3-oxoacyl-[acyl-carrier-protein] synthase II